MEHHRPRLCPWASVADRPNALPLHQAKGVAIAHDRAVYHAKSTSDAKLAARTRDTVRQSGKSSKRIRCQIRSVTKRTSFSRKRKAGMAKKRTVGERLNTPAKRARAGLRRMSAKLKPIKLEMMKSDSRPGSQNVDTKD